MIQKKIFFVKPSDSSFVKIDQEILKKTFKVYTYKVCYDSGISLLCSILFLPLKLLYFHFQYQIIFTRFADYHAAVLALFAKIFHKKLVIVIGGYDVYHIPEYHYGIYEKKIRGLCAKYALRNATLLLPNSNAMVYNTNSYATGKPIEAGIKFYAPDTKAKIKVLFNGFKIAENLLNNIQKENIILTVALIDNYKTYQMKGIDYFIQCAKNIPNYKFVIIGITHTFEKEIASEIPENLTIIQPLNHLELMPWYKKSKVFCLFSLSEGMPNVLCESMLYGCIPIGSDVSPIPDIIGDTGIIIKHKNTDEMTNAILLAVNYPDKSGYLAQERIIQNFSLEKREKELTDCLMNL